DRSARRRARAESRARAHPWHLRHARLSRRETRGSRQVGRRVGATGRLMTAASYGPTTIAADDPWLGAAYLAIVIYPDNFHRRDRLIDALRSFAAKSLRAQRGLLATPVRYRRANARDMRSVLHTADGLLWRRMCCAAAAGEVALRSVVDGSLDTAPALQRML